MSEPTDFSAAAREENNDGTATPTGGNSGWLGLGRVNLSSLWPTKKRPREEIEDDTDASTSRMASPERQPRARDDSEDEDMPATKKQRTASASEDAEAVSAMSPGEKILQTAPAQRTGKYVHTHRRRLSQREARSLKNSGNRVSELAIHKSPSTGRGAKTVVAQKTLLLGTHLGEGTPTGPFMVHSKKTRHALRAIQSSPIKKPPQFSGNGSSSGANGSNTNAIGSNGTTLGANIFGTNSSNGANSFSGFNRESSGLSIQSPPDRMPEADMGEADMLSTLEEHLDAAEAESQPSPTKESVKINQVDEESSLEEDIENIKPSQDVDMDDAEYSVPSPELGLADKEPIHDEDMDAEGSVDEQFRDNDDASSHVADDGSDKGQEPEYDSDASKEEVQEAGPSAKPTPNKLSPKKPSPVKTSPAKMSPREASAKEPEPEPDLMELDAEGDDGEPVAASSPKKKPTTIPELPKPALLDDDEDDKPVTASSRKKTAAKNTKKPDAIELAVEAKVEEPATSPKKLTSGSSKQPKASELEAEIEGEPVAASPKKPMMKRTAPKPKASEPKDETGAKKKTKGLKASEVKANTQAIAAAVAASSSKPIAKTVKKPDAGEQKETEAEEPVAAPSRKKKVTAKKAKKSKEELVDEGFDAESSPEEKPAPQKASKKLSKKAKKSEEELVDEGFDTEPAPAPETKPAPKKTSRKAKASEDVDEVPAELALKKAAPKKASSRKAKLNKDADTEVPSEDEAPAEPAPRRYQKAASAKSDPKAELPAKKQTSKKSDSKKTQTEDDVGETDTAKSEPSKTGSKESDYSPTNISPKKESDGKYEVHKLLNWDIVEDNETGPQMMIEVKWIVDKGKSDSRDQKEVTWEDEASLHADIRPLLLEFWTLQGGRDAAISEKFGSEMVERSYLVHEIVDDRPAEVKKSRGKGRGKAPTEYLVDWVGFSDKDRTWEPESNVTQECIKEYQAKIRAQ